GRSPSTRLYVNGFDSIRRNRVCSSPSEVNTDRGRLCTVASIPSFQCGNPSLRSSTLTRESENNARASSYPVMSHGVLPSQIRTCDTGLVVPSCKTSGGGANGQPGARLIGYSGMVSVSDIACFSFLDLYHLRGAFSDCPADVFGLLGRRVLVEKDDDAVFVALVEHRARVQHAVTRRDALVLVDCDFHRELFPPGDVTGANQSPTIASMRPDVACRHPERGTRVPSASARSNSAQVCISRLRAMMFRSVCTWPGRSGRQRLIPLMT